MPERQVRRRSERVPYTALVTLTAPQWGRPFEAWTTEISLDGVNLICPGPLPIGLVVSLTFHSSTPQGATEERLSGRVNKVRADVEASVVEVEFSEALSRRSASALAQTIERLCPDSRPLSVGLPFQ